MHTLRLTEAEAKALLLMIAFAQHNSDMESFKKDCGTLFKKIAEQMENE